ncbi:MAG: hypothetical protein IPG46_18145 [Actinobacteria bacterium]|nr:hypothetical protein [Actinomycetota bacterium]
MFIGAAFVGAAFAALNPSTNAAGRRAVETDLDSALAVGAAAPRPDREFTVVETLPNPSPSPDQALVDTESSGRRRSATGTDARRRPASL